MFDRINYKNIAKKQLEGRWVTPVVATLITSLIMVALGPTVPIVGLCAIAVVNIAYVYLFIVMSHTKEKQTISTFVQGFSFWLNGILGMLWFMLWTLIWTCLFFIPGIVKAYAYSQMFFIIAENPEMDVRQAMNISKKITNGHKMDLFVLDLSFIGWAILSAITGGILGLWVAPYYYMTKVNAFHSLKQQAIENKTINADIFGNSKATAAENNTENTATSSSTTQHVWDKENAEDAETVNTTSEPILLNDETSKTDDENNKGSTF